MMPAWVHRTAHEQGSRLRWPVRLAIRAQLAPGVMMYGISPEAVAVAVRRAIDQGTAA